MLQRMFISASRGVFVGVTRTHI